MAEAYLGVLKTGFEESRDMNAIFIRDPDRNVIEFDAYDSHP